MGAKKIQISGDGGTTYYSFPGSTGELSQENDRVGDTIFGYTFQSDEAGLTSWDMSANAVFKGFVGYKAKIKKGGTPTAFTDEATTLVSGKRYKITDAAKNMWDRATAVVVKDTAVAVDAADIKSIDYLFGEVEFVSSYVPSGAITVSGSFLATTQIAKAQNYSLSMTAEAVDESDFDAVQANGEYRIHSPGLRQVELSLSGFYAESLELRELLSARTELIVEIDPAGDGKSVARGFFKLAEDSQSGEVGALEEASHTLPLVVPENVDRPFAWVHANDSKIPLAIKTAITAWQDEAKVKMKYWPEGDATGSTGVSGDAVLTNISLEGSLDSMNTFSVEVIGDGPAAEIVAP